MTKDWQNATASGNLEDVRALLGSGTNINSLDRYGQTALMNAAYKGHVELTRLLTKHGANINHTAKNGLSAVMLAVFADHADVVRVLVDAGADLMLRARPHEGSADRLTAVELAEKMQRSRCVEVLKQAEIKHDHRD